MIRSPARSSAGTATRDHRAATAGPATPGTTPAATTAAAATELTAAGEVPVVAVGAGAGGGQDDLLALGEPGGDLHPGLAAHPDLHGPGDLLPAAQHGDDVLPVDRAHR